MYMGSHDLLLLLQLFNKTAAFLKHRNAKVISMKISEQQSSFHWAVEQSCCLIFTALKKNLWKAEETGQVNELKGIIINTSYGSLLQPV